ncbi:MAG: potassium channel protein [Candidatus Latescibacteria bacterium]|nr:potassium channel protein [Candidatus Latescibacterota bacterium]
MSPLVRFSIAFLLLVAILAGGTIGYSWIEEWPVEDSLYMTVITVTTVGFGEVKPLSPAGRQFTILLLILSIATLGYSVTTLIGFIFEGQIVQAMRGRRMERAIASLKDHYIICGCGVVGREVALEFLQAGVPFVVIDRDPKTAELGRGVQVLFIEGDADRDEILYDAGIERAKGLVSALRQDGDNIYVVLTARQLNPKLTIVARAAEEGTTEKLLRAGADRVICPYQIAGRRMASVILRPSVMSFLDVVVEGGDVTMRLEEVRVESSSPLVGKRLGESGIGERTTAKILAIQDPGGAPRTDPSGRVSVSKVVISEGDSLVALGDEDQLRTLRGFVR